MNSFKANFIRRAYMKGVAQATVAPLLVSLSLWLARGGSYSVSPALFYLAIPLIVYRFSTKKDISKKGFYDSIKFMTIAILSVVGFVAFIVAAFAALH